MMNKFILILAILIPFNVYSVGGVVTDPSSYMYYVEQLVKAEEMITNQIDQVEKATITADKLTGMKKQLEGSYNRIVGLPDRLIKASKALKKVPTNLQTDVSKIRASLGTNSGYLPTSRDIDKWDSLDYHVDGVFGDPRDPKWNPWKLTEKKYEMRQGILKNSLKQSTLKVHGLKNRLDELNKLFSSIDSTKNIKDSQDLTNRLLAELLTGQQEVIGILAHAAQAMAIMQYEGVTAKGSAARKVKQQQTQSNMVGSELEQEMRRLGVNENISNKDFEKRMGG